MIGKRRGRRNNLIHWIFFFFSQLTVHGMNKGKVSHLPEGVQSLAFPSGLVVDGTRLIEFPLSIDCAICQAIHPCLCNCSIPVVHPVLSRRFSGMTDGEN